MKKYVLTRSRKSYFIGYIFFVFFALTVVFLYILDIFTGFVIYLLSFPAVYLFLIPEYTRIDKKYFIKEDNVEEVSGIITKKRNIIPWNLVANVKMKKGIIGAMLDYGDIIISTMSGKENIIMRGISSPEKVLRKFEEKIGKRRVINQY